ncbi:dihydrodipicolinate synthase family protein [Membranihabitans maritimus]|uniref:dihydrodipicolinate synthase family protein n=1 Tax=Membranihabitans maritimus TaxID=2904244 RepID=UPI001F02CF2A|nr:dihydrodipicolinate synthase family protein [Membranihabitans maritimus]
MKFKKLMGLIAAPYTPFTKKGDLNLDVIPLYASFLKGNKVSGVFVGGTTGEGMLMTVEERKALATAWIEHQSDTFRVIVHVGASSYRDASALGQHAGEIKADAISTMGPLFLRPQNLDDLIHYCTEIVSCTGDIPFYYYHIPGISGVNFPMIEFLEKGESELPSLAGIKYTDSNLMDLNLCLNASDRKWDILYGQDETLLAGLAFGVNGAVGSTYNYMAPLYHNIINSFNNGEMEDARKYQQLAAKYVRQLIRFGGGVIAGKPIMKMIGVDCGPLRSPAHNLSSQQINDFEKRIKELDVLPYMLSKA